MCAARQRVVWRKEGLASGPESRQAEGDLCAPALRSPVKPKNAPQSVVV